MLFSFALEEAMLLGSQTELRLIETPRLSVCSDCANSLCENIKCVNIKEEACKEVGLEVQNDQKYSHTAMSRCQHARQKS